MTQRSEGVGMKSVMMLMVGVLMAANSTHAKLACQGSTTEWKKLGTTYVVSCKGGKRFAEVTTSARDAHGQLQSVSVRSKLDNADSTVSISNQSAIKKVRDSLRAGRKAEAHRLLRKAISRKNMSP